MMKLRRLFLIVAMVLAVGYSYAEAPANYYNSAEGKSGADLLSELCSIIGPHTDIGYSGLWTMYKDSDCYPGTNQIWDMYSTKKWTYSSEQCGSSGYSAVGDCYNREHSMPKSWFNSDSPMYSDGFHIYPTDGKVNSQRSNFPFGECANGTTLSVPSGIQALGKLGASTFSGYTGTVFEPVDEYKGDFARTYFYMAACYNDRIASWNSDMLANNSYPCFTTWAVNLLLKWHRQDPVSEKETNRNDAVYGYQKNRNPFIDHPELAEYIWGDKIGTGWEPGGTVTPAITLPVAESWLDLGIAYIGTTITKDITIKGQGLTENVTLSCAPFGISKTTLTAAEVNSGTVVTISYSSQSAEEAITQLIIKSGDIENISYIKAKAVSTIPTLAATNVSFDSFTANWHDIHDGAATYTLYVYDNNSNLVSGFPVDVNSAVGKYDVTGLKPLTKYSYLIKSGSMTSNRTYVTTNDYPRYISFDIDNEIAISVAPSSYSVPIAIPVVAEYIDTDITVSVTEGFEISTDKSNWSEMVTIDKTGETVYVRFTPSEPGTYNGTISAYTSTFSGTELDMQAIVADPSEFFEDFEKTTVGGYNTGNYEQTACTWYFKNTSNYSKRDGDKYNDTHSVCLNSSKKGGAYIEMAENKTDGAGHVFFQAAPYRNDADVTLTLSYSTDNGTTWKEVQKYTLPQYSKLTTYSATLNIGLPIRLRFTHAGGGTRANIDDIAIRPMSSGIDGVQATKEWDAFCRAGKLIIESNNEISVCIYNLEAKSVFAGSIKGEKSLKLDKGIYIVVNSDDSRKVVVK